MRLTDDGGVRWEETENPLTRYAELGGNIRGLAAWATLVTTALTGEPLGALDAFLDATAPERRAPKPPRLFISHQRKDARRADQVACVATSNGLDYWLDIHDPTLTWANSLPITGTAKGLLIAGIIEMALLNCKYVVAVQTLRSARSKWIPYEFGRVKAHRVASDGAAGWYHPAVRTAPLAEYFELGRKTYGHRPCTLPSPGNPWISLVDWIQARAHRLARPCSPVPTGILP